MCNHCAAAILGLNKETFSFALSALLKAHFSASKPSKDTATCIAARALPSPTSLRVLTIFGRMQGAPLSNRYVRQATC